MQYLCALFLLLGDNLAMENIKSTIKDACLWLLVLGLITLTWLGIEKMIITMLLG